MKKTNQQGFILMIVLMLAIVGFVVLFAVKRITEARAIQAQSQNTADLIN